MASYLKIFRLFLAKELRYTYPTPLAVVSHGASELITILLYWYTAKALMPKVEFLNAVGGDYFSYIIVGELALLVPSSLVYSFTKSVKELVATDTINFLSVQPYSKVMFLIKLSMANVPIRFIQICLTFILIVLGFGADFRMGALLSLLSLVVLSIPAFVGIGLLASSILLIYGRGEKFIITLTNISYLVAGVYFPTQVFPEVFANLLNFLSPYNVLLNAVRESASLNISLEQKLLSFLKVTLMSWVLFAVGFSACKLAFDYLPKRNKPLLV